MIDPDENVENSFIQTLEVQIGELMNYFNQLEAIVQSEKENPEVPTDFRTDCDLVRSTVGQINVIFLHFRDYIAHISSEEAQEREILAHFFVALAGNQGANNEASRDPKSALPRRRTLCTNSKKAR